MVRGTSQDVVAENRAAIFRQRLNYLLSIYPRPDLIGTTTASVLTSSEPPDTDQMAASGKARAEPSGFLFLSESIG